MEQITRADIARYKENWLKETESASLYRLLADKESRPQLAEVYRRLAAVEEKHATVWEGKLKAAGAEPPKPRRRWRARLLTVVAKYFGSQSVLPSITALEHADGQSYTTQPEAAGTDLPAQEQSHARLLRVITGPLQGGLEGGALAQFEGRHRAAGGNALRAAVLGANDGLTSNLSLIMGVAGANLAENTIILTGFAGLLAGAISMALGEWLSVQSSRELYLRQISIEERELAEVPDEEEEELALIYQAKGVPENVAREMASHLISNPETALSTLAREELGIDPEELGGSAWEAAGTSFILFAMGAIIPVLPFILFKSMTAVVASIALSTCGLFLIGAAVTMLTGRGVMRSGLRMVIFGLSAAALTFTIGRLIGVSLAG